MVQKGLRLREGTAGRGKSDCKEEKLRVRRNLLCSRRRRENRMAELL